MTADRRPAPVLAVDGQAGSADLDVTLTSVLITSRLQLAILTSNKDAMSYRVRVGETVQGSNWRLVQLEPRRAVIEGPSGQRVLELRVSTQGRRSADDRVGG
jgi:general secretion pathway protein N